MNTRSWLTRNGALGLAAMFLLIASLRTWSAGYLVNNTDSLIHYDASWWPSGPRGQGDYCDDEQYSVAVGGVASFTFNGTGLDYIAPKGNEGNVDVYIDGAFKTNVNLASPTALPQQMVYGINGLVPGNHTIKIVNKSPTPGMIDAFRIYGGPPILKLACVGDSITYGSGTLGDNSWPSQLGRMLGNGHTIGNYGIPGATMLKNGDAPYWNSWALAHATNWLPDIVIIALGANDSKPQNWVHKDQFVGDYETMVTMFQILPSHPTVYISTCSTVQGSGAYGITKAVVADEVVPLQRQVATNKTCRVIDVNTATQNLPTSDYIDGVHPTDAGHLVIAETVYTNLIGLVPPPPPAIPETPVNLAASGGNGQIALSWTRVWGLAAYDLKRSTVKGGPYMAIATNRADAAYTDTGLVNGKTFYYVVSAQNISGESSNSLPASAVPSAQIDLALNHPVTVSSVADGTAAASAVDGDLGTRWSSDHSDPQWIYVDLGTNYSMTRVKLSWEAAYAQAYQIQVSADATNWTTIYSTSAGHGGVEDLTGLSGKGRYVRMYGTVRGSIYGYSLFEFQVYAAPTASPGIVPVSTRTFSSG